MEIGLIRHFKVALARPSAFLLSYQEVCDWFARYEETDVLPDPVEPIPQHWDICYASSASRAYTTATAVYSKDIVRLDALRELNTLSLLKSNRRMPLLFWAIQLKRKSATENEITATFRQGLTTFLDEILAGEHKKILIVSHGFVMMFLKEELTKRGFTGERFRYPRNGKLYTFRRKQG